MLISADKSDVAFANRNFICSVDRRCSISRRSYQYQLNRMKQAEFCRRRSLDDLRSNSIIDTFVYNRPRSQDDFRTHRRQLKSINTLVLDLEAQHDDKLVFPPEVKEEHEIQVVMNPTQRQLPETLQIIVAPHELGDKEQRKSQFGSLYIFQPEDHDLSSPDKSDSARARDRSASIHQFWRRNRPAVKFWTSLLSFIGLVIFVFVLSFIFNNRKRR